MNWLPETWIQTIGWTLVHSLWIIPLVALGLQLLLAIVPNRLVKARYLMAVTALLVTVAALVITGFYVHQPAAETTSTVIAETSGEIPFFIGKLMDQNPTELQWATIRTKLHQWFAPHLSGILVIWFSGVLFFLLRGAGRLVYLHRLTQWETQSLTPQWQKTLTRMTQLLGVQRNFSVRVSTHIRSPFVAGFLKPIILIPLSAFSQLSPEQLEAILVHELAHIRRWDDMVNWLQTAVEITLFYHPALWWISQVIRDEREKCCDDLAVATCGSALVYTKALTQLESLPSSTSAFALALTRSGNGLLGRVERLLQPHKLNNKPSVVPILITIVLVAGLAINYQFNPPQRTTDDIPVYSGLIAGLEPEPALEMGQPQHDSSWQPTLPDWLKESSERDTIPSEGDSLATAEEEKNTPSTYRIYSVPGANRFKVDSLSDFYSIDSSVSFYSFLAPGVHLFSLDSLPHPIVIPPDVDLDILEEIEVDLDVLEDIEVLIDSVQGRTRQFFHHNCDTLAEPDCFSHSPQQLKTWLNDSIRVRKFSSFNDPFFRIDSLRNVKFPDAPQPPAVIFYDSARQLALGTGRWHDRTLARLDSLVSNQQAWFVDSVPTPDLQAIEEALANLPSSNIWREKALENQLRSLEEQQQHYESLMQIREKQYEDQVTQWQEKMEAWESQQQKLQKRFEQRQSELQQRYEEQVRSLAQQEEELRQQQERWEDQKKRKIKKKLNKNQP